MLVIFIDKKRRVYNVSCSVGILHVFLAGFAQIVELLQKYSLETLLVPVSIQILLFLNEAI